MSKQISKLSEEQKEFISKMINNPILDTWNIQKDVIEVTKKATKMIDESNIDLKEHDVVWSMSLGRLLDSRLLRGGTRDDSLALRFLSCTNT